MFIKDYSDCSTEHSLLWKNGVSRDFLGFSFCDSWEAMRFRLSVKFEGRGDRYLVGCQRTRMIKAVSRA